MANGIYRIPGAHLRNVPKGGVKFYEIVAKGLRNSMAMVVHPSGNLIQGENSRDFPARHAESARSAVASASAADTARIPVSWSSRS